jgi:hypothetical protein
METNRKGSDSNINFLRNAWILQWRRVVSAGSHYGHPSREAVRLSGQTLLRVQRNELKINSQ